MANGVVYIGSNDHTLYAFNQMYFLSGSYNQGLLRAAQEPAPDWVEVQFFDIGTLPFFNEDVEAAGDPEPVRRYKDAIRASNALLIATPEYNGSVPGILANAFDWASRPTGRSVLRNKPVAVMGAVLGKSGSANAQAILRGVLGRIGCAGYLAHPFSKETVFALVFRRCDPSFRVFFPGSRSLQEGYGCLDHDGFSACSPGVSCLHLLCSQYVGEAGFRVTTMQRQGPCHPTTLLVGWRAVGMTLRR